MPLADRLVLARALARAAARVGRDALAARRGGALPLGPEALTDPARFSALTARGLPPGGDPLGRPSGIRRTSHEAPSSNCRNSVLTLEWPEGVAGPASVFVKQPAEQLSIQVFANLAAFWKIECAVCRNLSAQVPIETPRVYAVLEQGSRFLLVLENLLERPAVRLFVNQALLEGVDLPTAERCLQGLAALHAGFAGRSEAERERALPMAFHPFLSNSLSRTYLALNREASGRCHARAPDLFDEAALSLYGRTLQRWSKLAEVWYRGPLTLCHGDSHLGNFFLDGDKVGMLDFQGAHWGPGLRDVQYFLINSMPSEELAKHEKRLVEGYAAEVTRRGAPLDGATAWEQYRSLSFQTLMTAVASMGLGSFIDSDAVIRTMLARSVAATRRLEFGAWLESVA